MTSLADLDIAFDTTELFIGGRFVQPDGPRHPVEDPSEGVEVGAITDGGQAALDEAVAAARSALDDRNRDAWGGLNAADRGRWLMRLSAAVKERFDWFARIESFDVGKPLAQAKADVTALARYLEFYGGAADKLHGTTIPYETDTTVYTLREPFGVTGHIIPWNYPLQILGRSVGAALATGNAAVLKPAEEASLSSLAFARVAAEIGLPPGALNIVTGVGETTGAALTAHPGIDHISFTGSNAVGQLVQKAAAENVVPVTLELGGKCPQIVFADADLDAALPFLVKGGLQNAGQTCSATSRVLVERSVFARLRAMLAERYTAMRVGRSLDDLDVGPIISAEQKQRIEGYLDLIERDALPIAARGQLHDTAPRSGHYIVPHLIDDPGATHTLAMEEIFGPVQVLLPFDDEDEAVAIANAPGYGLVAGVWTSDGARQMRMAKRVRAGQIFINNYGAGGGVELPFGGVGQSGHGREKGFEALYGFTQLKTVAAKHG